MFAAVVAALLSTSLPKAYAPPPPPPCQRTRNSSIQDWHESNNGQTARWTASWSGDGCSVDFRSTGDVKFNADFTDVISITNGGTLDVSADENGTTRRLFIRSDNGRLVRTYSVNGREQAWNDDAARWFADLLIDLDRTTAAGVEYRFPTLFAHGGAGAVLGEVEKMGGDYARSVYLRRLIDTQRLSDGEYQRAVTLAAHDMTSDYELSRVLRDVAERTSLDNDTMRRAYLDAVHKMSSDYERSRVLQTVFSKSTVSHEVAADAVRAAASFGSDYERSRVLLAAIESKALDKSDLVPVIETAAKSQSDYEKSRVLQAVAARWTLDADARKAYLRAADTIKSDYENRRVLSALVRQE